MSKKIKISVKNSGKLEFFLEEKAEKNDYICLNDINKINFDNLQKALKEKKDKYYKYYFDTNKEKLKSNLEEEFKNSVEYKGLLKKQQDYNHLIEIHNIEIEHLNKQHDLLKKSFKNDFLQSSEYQKKVSEETLRIKKIYHEQIDELKKKLKDTKEEIQNISRTQNNWNSKLIGENLEDWIQSRYNDAFLDSNNTKLEKTTKAKDGTKPDFLFKIIDESTKKELNAVIIEAKSESLTSQNKKKNKDHYKKLWSDQKKWKAKYSLLVSELEKNQDFLIQKVNYSPYVNMYVVRPAYFITFLKLLVAFVQDDYFLNENLNVNIREKKEILKEFEDLKEKFIKDFIIKIKREIDKIHSHSKQIEKHTHDIQTITNKLIDLEIAKITKRVNDFKLDKIIKKLNK